MHVIGQICLQSIRRIWGKCWHISSVKLVNIPDFKLCKVVIKTHTYIMTFEFTTADDRVSQTTWFLLLQSTVKLETRL